MYTTLLSHIDFHAPTFWFLQFGLFWNRAKAFVDHMRKSTRATKELHNLQKQQVLKDTPQGDLTITNPKLMRGTKTKARKRGGKVQEVDPITRVLALRVSVDIKKNSL